MSRSRPAVPLRARRSYPYILAGIAIVAGLGASWIVATIRARPKVQIVATAANEAPAAAGAPSAASVDLTEVAVTGEGDEKVGGGDKLTSCVAAHFPKDTFKKAPDLAWLCTEADPRVGGEKLRAAVVQGAAGGTTAAMKSMSQLGWYEMVELAVVRAGCCTEMKALTLPEPAAGCDALAQILTELGKAAAAGQSLEEPLGRYQKAAECEHKAKRASLFRRGGAPAATELAAFRELAKSVQAP